MMSTNFIKTSVKCSDIEYKIFIEKVDNCYIAHCEEVPNAHTQGRTIEEVQDNIKEVIELILDCEKEIAQRKIKKKNVFFRKIAVL